MKQYTAGENRVGAGKSSMVVFTGSINKMRVLGPICALGTHSAHLCPRGPFGPLGAIWALGAYVGPMQNPFGAHSGPFGAQLGPIVPIGPDAKKKKTSLVTTMQACAAHWKHSASHPTLPLSHWPAASFISSLIRQKASS